MFAGIVFAAVTIAGMHPMMQWEMPLYVVKAEVVSYDAAGKLRSVGKGDPGKWCGSYRSSDDGPTVYSCAYPKADPIYTYVIRKWRVAGRIVPDEVCTHFADGWFCGPGSEK